MSNRKNTSQEWQPEIDASYESRVTALQQMEHRPTAVVPVQRMTEADREELGLSRPGRNTFVPAPQNTMPTLPAQASTAHIIDVQPSATQHVEVRTSFTDRATGFLIFNVPLFVVLGVLTAAVVIQLGDYPVLSFAAFITFWLTFAVCWLASFIHTLNMSAEGVARYEAKRKWDVIAREQAERWNHYNRQLGGK